MVKWAYPPLIFKFIWLEQNAFFTDAIMINGINRLQLAKMKKSIPYMSLP